MRQDIEALHELGRIATKGEASRETLALAASIIRRATGSAEAMVVYAEDKKFLTCSHDDAGADTELTLAALTWVQRYAAQTNEPVAFNLVGRRVEDFTSALSDDDRQFLAFTVPTTESAAEMCILRGPWDHKARPGILRFMESAMPALTLILETFLNAERSRRQGELLKVLANAAQVLTRSEDVEAALRNLATAASASTGFEYIVNIDLYDATTGRFFLRVLSEQRYTGGTLGQIWGASLNPDRPDPWNMEVMTTLQPSFRPDMQNDPIYPEHVRKFYAQSLLKSAADFPLLFQDEFLGTMAFVSYKPSTFPPEEVSFLQGLVTQAAMAIKAMQMHKELQRYAQEIQKAADQYIATTNLTGDVIARLDELGRWTFLNDAACQFFGKPREELLGTDSRAHVYPEDLERTAQAIREMRAAGEPVTGFVNRHVTLAGTRVVEWNGYPLFDDEGEYAGIQITGRDITERKKAEEERDRLYAELEVKAVTDGLTDLYDHAHFYQRLNEEIDRSRRYKHAFAVVMMDVDEFKRYNDSRGHQAGDEALRLLADCIRMSLRRSDLAFRYGGDEFAAILPYTNSSKARAVVERINGRIAKALQKMDGGAGVRLSMSCGVARFPDDGTTADDLVRMADAALYSDKWVARARDIMGQREDIQSLISALVGRRTGVEGAAASEAFLQPEALHEHQARIVASVASSIAVALKDAGVPQALEDPDLQVVATVGAAAEIKDRYIRGHPERTSEWSAALAQEMGLSAERVRNIRIAGLLHDIGKVTVSEGILNKPGKLTKQEFASIKDHPIVGATLVSQVKGFERPVPIVRHHHEGFDGKGYPDGLAGEEIPLEARILRVVDVFDALTHERAYRQAVSREKAIAELERGAGNQFDPRVVKAFIGLVERQGEELAAPAEAASKDEQLTAARVSGRGKG